MSVTVVTDPQVAERAATLRDDQLYVRRARIDRMFAALLFVEYLAGIAAALVNAGMQLV